MAGNGGSLAIALAPGDYSFSASPPGAATNGSVKVVNETGVQIAITLDVPSGQMKVYIQ